MKRIVFFLLSVVAIVPLLSWLAIVVKGKRFALRDRLRKADAIVVMAGTRGDINFLHGKVRTGVKLYKQGWASTIIMSGKFSAKVTSSPTLIPVEELQEAVTQGRIQEKDVAPAAKTWDIALGATYMQEMACAEGVLEEAILLENESLHTRESAEMVLELALSQGMKCLILVTSPFHQRRTYLTFAKVAQGKDITILNYYADSGEWHPFTWFFSKKHRQLVKSEEERIKLYREKGDLL